MQNRFKLRTLIFVALAVALSLIIFANVNSLQKNIPHQASVSYSVDDPQFLRSLGHFLGPPIINGNKVTALYNGAQIFPAMLKAISNAEKTIAFESYIYWSGRIGEKFLDALIERANAGVKVHILIDWVGGSKMESSYLDRLKASGAEVEYYRPLKWYNIFRVNNRSHRKTLVVDGKIGFTGGVGIADAWDGNGDSPEVWRDSHFQIEGPAVAYMQAAFMDNWLKTRPEVLHDEKYFPAVESVGPALAQVFISSAQEGSASMRLMYLFAIAAAKESLLLASAYFVPDDLAIEELLQARRRGVRIEIIVPGPYTDTFLVQNVSKAQWGKLLEAGIEIYQFQPAMFHCKVLIVDRSFVSVGSTNFDDRSFRLNDESNLNIIDPDFAASEIKTFDRDKRNSKRITLEEWKNRSMVERLKEKFGSILKSQM